MNLPVVGSMRNNMDEDNLFDMESILTTIEAFSTFVHGPILKKLISRLSNTEINSSITDSTVTFPFLVAGSNHSSNEFTAIRVV